MPTLQGCCTFSPPFEPKFQEVSSPSLRSRLRGGQHPLEPRLLKVRGCFCLCHCEPACPPKLAHRWCCRPAMRWT
eukprot:2238640-Alexandrium_andersonii.AAC.1